VVEWWSGREVAAGGRWMCCVRALKPCVFGFGARARARARARASECGC
jgi:hypothetical protein